MLVERELRSGLVVAEQSADEASVSRALKLIDPRYVLQKHPSEVEGGWVYKVVCVVSDTQAPVIFTWCDDHGNPLPLSSGLVEDLKRWRPEARDRRGFDADTHNARLEQSLDRDRANTTEALHDDHAGRVERGRVTVGLGATSRMRYWQRNLHRPRWLR